MATALYCTQGQVELLLSEDGVDLASDDDADSVQDAIGEASRELDAWLLQGYAEADLAASGWVSYCCRAYAARNLCERRGNPVPEGVKKKIERYDLLLAAILEGRMHVPGLARRRVDAPTMATPRVRIGPFGPQTVISRKRGPARNQPQDYDRRDDRTEPDPPPY